MDADFRGLETRLGYVMSGFSRSSRGAARGGNDDPLAASEPLRSVLGVTEGLPGDRKAVDPRLELRRNAEVVHGRPDHQGIGNQELVERRLSRSEIPHILPVGREGALKTGEMKSA